jgi:hypothetical protein
MLLYPNLAVEAIGAGGGVGPGHGHAAGGIGEDGVEAPAGVVALRAGEVYRPGDAGAWLAGQATPAGGGQQMVFCRPVALLPVLRRRSGAVYADGWLADHVRLGVLEQLLPAGLIEALVATVPGVRDALRRRVMSAALTVRFVLALALWPDADYVEVMRRLVGDLPVLPWARPWAPPCSRVISKWRARVPAVLFERLFWAVAGPLCDQREPGAYVNGLLVCALDGFMCDLPATAANREYFGSAGGKNNAGPFPQLRAVIMVGCRSRGTLAAAAGPARVGEQTLSKALVNAHPEAFGEGRLVVMDRNFPGYRLIEAIRTAGAQVLIRIKAGIALPVVRVLPDGSYLTFLYDRRRQACMMLRVVEYNVSVPGREEVSETFTLATSLLDPDQWTPAQLRDAYPLRWSGAETAIGQNKSAITDAGPSRGPMLRAQSPEQVRQELWAWLVTSQLVRAAAAQAAARANTGKVRLGRPSQPRDLAADPVACREIGFTNTRRAVAATVWRTTAPTLRALAAQAEATAVTILSDLLQLDRQRFKARRVKWWPDFPHTSHTVPTHPGPATINPFPLTDRPDTS